MPVLRDAIYEDDDFNELSQKDGFLSALDITLPQNLILFIITQLVPNILVRGRCMTTRLIVGHVSEKPRYLTNHRGTLYYEYLSDFIQLMGKDWSVESVVHFKNN